MYIIPVTGTKQYESEVENAIQNLSKIYPGITLDKKANGWQVIIPEKYKVGHEAHFAQVMQRYLQYLQNGKLPEWEVPDMIAKYYTSTKAVEMAGNK